MDNENKFESPAGAVTALVGLRALERAVAEAEAGTEICSGVDVPYYPRLSVRSNARAVRMVLPGIMTKNCPEAAVWLPPGFSVFSSYSNWLA